MTRDAVSGTIRSFVISTLTLLAAAGAARSETISGNDLLSACSETSDSVRSGFCVGYVIGVIEGLRYGASVPVLAAQATKSNDELNATVEKFLDTCPPAEVEYGQHRDVIVQYLAEHPETRHNSARFLALEALREAFPCQ